MRANEQYRKDILIDKTRKGLLSMDEVRELGRLREQERENKINSEPSNFVAVYNQDAAKFEALRNVNHWLAEAIEDVIDMHIKKAHDYASVKNPFINFENVARAVGFDADVVFRQFIAVKLDRLRNLLSTDKVPNNESIDDTKLDLAVYALLYLAYAKKQASNIK
jgi:hypothetical protein